MMRVTFRCKRSGNTVSFASQSDIESMRKLEHYEEVKDEEARTEKADAEESAESDDRDSGKGQGETIEVEAGKMLKRRGRPPAAKNL